MDLSYGLSNTLQKISTLKYGNEGLIFVPVNHPYVPGRSEKLLLWRPVKQINVDFKIKTIIQNQRDKKPVFHIMIADKNQYKKIDQLTLEPSIEKEYDKNWETRIQEQGYAPQKRIGGWRFIKFCPDKQTADTEQSLQETLQAIENAVSREMLEERSSVIRNNWKVRQPSKTINYSCPPVISLESRNSSSNSESSSSAFPSTTIPQSIPTPMKPIELVQQAQDSKSRESKFPTDQQHNYLERCVIKLDQKNHESFNSSEKSTTLDENSQNFIVSLTSKENSSKDNSNFPEMPTKDMKIELKNKIIAKQGSSFVNNNISKISFDNESIANVTEKVKKDGTEDKEGNIRNKNNVELEEKIGDFVKDDGKTHTNMNNTKSIEKKMTNNDIHDAEEIENSEPKNSFKNLEEPFDFPKGFDGKATNSNSEISDESSQEKLSEKEEFYDESWEEFNESNTNVDNKNTKSTTNQQKQPSQQENLKLISNSPVTSSNPTFNTPLKPHNLNIQQQKILGSDSNFSQESNYNLSPKLQNLNITQSIANKESNDSQSLPQSTHGTKLSRPEISTMTITTKGNGFEELFPLSEKDILGHEHNSDLSEFQGTQSTTPQTNSKFQKNIQDNNLTPKPSIETSNQTFGRKRSLNIDAISKSSYQEGNFSPQSTLYDLHHHSQHKVSTTYGHESIRKISQSEEGSQSATQKQFRDKVQSSLQQNITLAPELNILSYNTQIHQNSPQARHKDKSFSENKQWESDLRQDFSPTDIQQTQLPTFSNSRTLRRHTLSSGINTHRILSSALDNNHQNHANPSMSQRPEFLPSTQPINIRQEIMSPKQSENQRQINLSSPQPIQTNQRQKSYPQTDSSKLVYSLSSQSSTPVQRFLLPDTFKESSFPVQIHQSSSTIHHSNNLSSPPQQEISQTVKASLPQITSSQRPLPQKRKSKGALDFILNEGSGSTNDDNGSTNKKSLLVGIFPFNNFIESSSSSFLHYWLGFELLFYFYFLLTKSRLQKLLEPVTLRKDQRTKILHDCLQEIEDFKTWIEGWFKVGDRKTTFDQIHRLAWSFFGCGFDQIQNKEHENEIIEIISLIEISNNIKFPEGYNPNCKCIKLTLDPVKAIPRPFIYYMSIYVLNYIVRVFLGLCGFEHKSCKESILNGYWSSTLEFDIQEENSLSSLSKISYWYFNPSNKKRKKKAPIVFIHGVGGLFCYFTFIKKLRKLNRPLFLVELPYVSFQMVEDVPKMHETVEEIERMIISKGYSSAIFVGHSLGTSVCSWMIKEAPKRVKGLVLVDPICFLLHHSDIAFNFVYRKPVSASEYLTALFASRELYISHYFSRHFHWHETALFISKQKIFRKNAFIYLSELDNIIPSDKVYKYLSDKKVSVNMMSGLDHANFLFNTYWVDKIINDILYCCDNCDSARRSF
ncbi:13782_t:CDS:10 [Entrophospora sp. SA101]|nr:13782_t:CDS:10 [Entrophospora sp. SA101]